MATWGMVFKYGGKHLVRLSNPTNEQCDIVHAHELVTELRPTGWDPRIWVVTLNTEAVELYGPERVVELLDEEIAPGAQLNDEWLGALHAALSAHADSEQ